MKKLILLFTAVSCSLCVFAQSVNTSVYDHIKTFNPISDVGITTPAAKSPLTGAMRTTTRGGSKWYFHEPIIDALLGGEISSNNLHTILPMWWDSTVSERFFTRIYPVQYAGVCEYQEPQFNLYNDTTLFPSSDIKVTATDAYIVDSVRIHGIYNYAFGHTKKDTLIVSVAPVHYSMYWSASLHEWLHGVASASSDTLYAFMPYYTDSIHRAAFADSSIAVATLDTFILDPVAKGEQIDPVTEAYDSLQVFTFPINTKGIGGHKGCAVPANFRYAITVAFKSGNTWRPNLDSIEGQNDFMVFFGYEGSTTGPNWMTNWYQDYSAAYNDTGEYDENATSLLDTRGKGYGPDQWVSSYAIQLLDSARQYPYQYAFIEGHVNCVSCQTISGVNNIAGIISNVNAYPSPAKDVLFIPFTLAQHANVTITLTNAIGQVVRTQQIGNTATGKAQFNVSDLPSGVYFYNLQANEQRITRRIVIAH